MKTMKNTENDKYLVNAKAYFSCLSFPLNSLQAIKQFKEKFISLFSGVHNALYYKEWDGLGITLQDFNIVWEVVFLIVGGLWKR